MDLHAHLPMYLRAPGRRAAARQSMIDRAGRNSGNYLPAGGPRVTVPALRRGGVRTALSVLYSPFDELSPGRRDLPRLRWLPRVLRTIRRQGTVPTLDGAMSLALAVLVADRPPNPGAFGRLLAQLESVERHVARRHAREAAFARSADELDGLREDGRVALVHAVEGGFHLPADPAAVADAVAELARRGVAYVTVAHLFHRQVATVAPAIPYLPDDVFHTLFPQPAEGLSPTGRAIVEAAVRNGVLVDVAHMSDESLRETFALFDRLDPDRQVPLVASHVGYRFGGQAYNLPDWAIAEIAARGGVVGMIAATHQLADGVPAPRDFAAGMELLFRHVDAVAAAAGGHDHTALGTDLGGFIEPLPGVEGVGDLGAVRTALAERYGAEVAEQIAGGNAERVLRAAWGRGVSPSPRSGTPRA